MDLIIIIISHRDVKNYIILQNGRCNSSKIAINEHKEKLNSDNSDRTWIGTNKWPRKVKNP